MNTQFFIAVSSSLTTALILYIVRVLVKAKGTVTRLAEEHKFLMYAMNRVLIHLKLEDDMARFSGKKGKE